MVWVYSYEVNRQALQLSKVVLDSSQWDGFDAPVSHMGDVKSLHADAHEIVRFIVPVSYDQVGKLQALQNSMELCKDAS